MKKRIDALNITEGQKRIIEYVFTFLLVLLIFSISRVTGIKNEPEKVKPLMLAALAVLGGYAVYLKIKGRLTSDKAVMCVVIAGIIMRVGYTIYTHMFINGHDLGGFSASDTGHLGYIYNLAENGKLPSSYENQLYHPPLFHMAAALVIRVAGLFTGTEDMHSLFEFSQIINCSLCCIMLLVLKNFFAEIELDGKYAPWAMLIAAFIPGMYQIGGRLNNDMPVIFFMLLCIINTYRWYRKRDMRTIIYLALSFGLGMMSKISCGIMALFTAPVMIYVLYTDIKNKRAKETIKQLAVFALICFPLGLWYPIRNYILFKQPFNYVMRLERGHFVYRGDIPWYKRFFELSVSGLIKQPFVNVYEDSSIPMSVLRTSLFDETTFDSRIWAAGIANVINLVLAAVSVVCMVYVLVKRKGIDIKNTYGLFFAWLIIIGTFVQFNAAYPAFCTANFRYIPLAEVLGGVFVGYAMKLVGDTDKKSAGYIMSGIKILIAVWCVFVNIMYI